MKIRTGLAVLSALVLTRGIALSAPQISLGENVRSGQLSQYGEKIYVSGSVRKPFGLQFRRGAHVDVCVLDHAGKVIECETRTVHQLPLSPVGIRRNPSYIVAFPKSILADVRGISVRFANEPHENCGRHEVDRQSE